MKKPPNTFKQSATYQKVRHIYHWIINQINILPQLFTIPKPEKVSWLDFVYILSHVNRYQPLVFADGSVISRMQNQTILDSRQRLELIQLPQDLTGKTVLDIGCAEGFFVVQSALRNAKHATGCDMLASRLKMGQIVAQSWMLQDTTTFSQTLLYDIPKECATDIVMCFAMAHHLHGGDHDTWHIISDRVKRSSAFANMLRAVTAVAALTKEITYWEYAFEYENEKPTDVDHAILGQIWVEQGIYEKVDFIGLSQSLPHKDRALYKAYKHA